VKDIDEQIKLIFEVLPNYLEKYGCQVKIVKTDLKTEVFITSKKRKFKITFKEVKE